MREENREIAQRITQAMAEKKINQATLSRLTGIPDANINRYCKGLYLPKMGNLIKIAKALSVNPDWIINGESNKTETPQEELDAKRELLGLVMNLNKDQAKKVSNFIKEYIL